MGLMKCWMLFAFLFVGLFWCHSKASSSPSSASADNKDLSDGDEAERQARQIYREQTYGTFGSRLGGLTHSPVPLLGSSSSHHANIHNRQPSSGSFFAPYFNQYTPANRASASASIFVASSTTVASTTVSSILSGSEVTNGHNGYGPAQVRQPLQKVPFHSFLPASPLSPPISHGRAEMMPESAALFGQQPSSTSAAMMGPAIRLQDLNSRRYLLDDQSSFYPVAAAHAFRSAGTENNYYPNRVYERHLMLMPVLGPNGEHAGYVAFNMAGMNAAQVGHSVHYGHHPHPFYSNGHHSRQPMEFVQRI